MRVLCSSICALLCLSGVASGRVLQVVALDEEGRPVAGACALALDAGGKPLAGRYGAPRCADSQGRIKLELRGGKRHRDRSGIPPGLELGIWAPGRAATRVTDLEDGDFSNKPIEVVLPPGGCVRGKVEIDGKPGKKRVGMIWLSSKDHMTSSYMIRIPVDAAGRFRACGLTPGPYRVISWPLGAAPVLAPDARGQLALVACAPARSGSARFRVLNPSIRVDGKENIVRVSFDDTRVSGRVLDENGRAVSAAKVEISKDDRNLAVLRTSADGRFEMQVPPAEWILIRAFHPEFGRDRDFESTGWLYSGPIPAEPIELTLRKGVVLAGRILDPAGRPLAGMKLLLIPAYRGSGPWPVEVRTDARGRFSFPRLVLGKFEIVVGDLDAWHPETRHGLRARDFVRILDPKPADWLDKARAGRELELRTEKVSLRIVPVDVIDSAGRRAANRELEVWRRWGPDKVVASKFRTDARGRFQFPVESDKRYEIWIEDLQEPWVAPWTEGKDPGFEGVLPRPDEKALRLVAE